MCSSQHRSETVASSRPITRTLLTVLALSFPATTLRDVCLPFAPTACSLVSPSLISTTVYEQNMCRGTSEPIITPFIQVSWVERDRGTNLTTGPDARLEPFVVQNDLAARVHSDALEIVVGNRGFVLLEQRDVQDELRQAPEVVLR